MGDLFAFTKMQGITDKGLKLVSSTCSELRVLSFFNGTWGDRYLNKKVTNEGIGAIARGCPELETITLRYFDITDECNSTRSPHPLIFLVFQNFHNLSNVTIKACQKITMSGLKELIAANPNLTSLSLEDLKSLGTEEIQELKNHTEALVHYFSWGLDEKECNEIIYYSFISLYFL